MILDGVISKQGKLFTKNKVPGKRINQERLVKISGREYREWLPEHSKLASAMKKGIKQLGIKKDSIILYLGCSHGTTVSHISDFLDKGFIFALDFVPRVLREMIMVAEDRNNIAPILASASQIEKFANKVPEVDVVYQDIAQRNQVDMFLDNCKRFLKKGGFSILCVKSRSIDVQKRPGEVYAIVRKELEKELTIIDYKKLDPYQKHHAFFVCKKN